MPSDTTTSAEDRAQHEAERVELAARLMKAKAERNLTWDALAGEVGVPSSTLSLWATGKYQGRVDTQNGAVRRYFDARAHRDTMAFDALREAPFVETPSAVTFHAELRKAQFLPTMSVIVGAPGVGKTYAAEAYAASTPNVTMITALACHPSGRWLLEGLGRALRLTERGGSQRLGAVIIDHLRDKRALVIVDEANHLSPEAIDMLRGITRDGAKCGLALLGSPRTISRFEGGRDADFAQLLRRIGGRINRQKPVRQDAEMILDAYGVHDEGVRKLLRAQAARPGALGLMCTTLRLAQMLATSKGEGLAEAHIVAADEQLRGVAE
jgi:DNA transposition AAA+ family ATPase